MNKIRFSLCFLLIFALPISVGFFPIVGSQMKIIETHGNDLSVGIDSAIDSDPIQLPHNSQNFATLNESYLWVKEAQYFYSTYSIWSDGEYFYTSGTGQYGWGWGTCMRVMKWHLNGTIIWQLDKQSGDFLERDAYGYGIWGDNYSNVYVCGYLGYYSGGGVLLKIHSNGTLLWEKGSNGYDIWGDENHLYVCGGWGSFYHSISKWDFDGNKIWEENATCDEGFNIWGTDTHLYTITSYGTVIKWDQDGNQIWNVTYGSSDSTYFYSVTSDGTSVYAGGYSIQEGIGESKTKAVLAKWDQNGELVWERYCNNETYSSLRSLFYYDEAIYSLGGTRNVYSSTGTDILLQKWDTEGNLLWNTVWEYVDHQNCWGLWVNPMHLITSSLWGVPDSMDIMLVHLWDINGTTVSQPKPHSPILQSINQYQNKINLDWSDVDNATSYNVYLSDEYPFDYSDMWKVANVNISNYIDYGVPMGTKYYAVTALNDWGESDISNIESIKVRNRENTYMDLHQQWYEIVGDTGEDSGEALWGDDDFLYTCGTIWNYDSTSQDLFLAKWDKKGNLIWQRYWGDNQNRRGTAIWGDDNYLYTSGLKNSNYGILIKWDKDGNEIWNRTWYYGYSGSRGHWGKPSKVWGNENYIYTAGGFDLIQWDKDGNKLWERDTHPASVWCDEEYVYSATAWGYLYKLLNNGTQIAYVNFGGNRNSQSESVTIWSEGQYLYICENGITKLDLTGEVVWAVNSDGIIKSITKYGDKLITVGEYQGDLNITYRNQDGDILDSWMWGGPEYDIGNSIYVNLDGIFVVGSTESYGSGNSDFLLFKWSENTFIVYRIIESALMIGMLGLIIVSSVMQLKRKSRKAFSMKES